MSKDDKGDNSGHGKGPEEHEVQVHFRHIADAERAEFKMPETATLQATWDRAYDELHVPKNAGDVLQTADNPPKALTSVLSLTLKAAKDQDVIKNYHFEIAAVTGGA